MHALNWIAIGFERWGTRRRPQVFEPRYIEANWAERQWARFVEHGFPSYVHLAESFGAPNSFFYGVGQERTVKIEIQSMAAADEHPLLGAFASIRDRELRGSDEHSFIAEGEVVLRVLLSQRRYAVRAVLLARQHWERLSLELPADVPVFVAPLSVMQDIVGFPIHRGILALGSRGNEASASDILASDGMHVALGLCGITNHDNVGGLFRNAAAFGADSALLDRATCDPLYRKALRVSVGGCLVVPHAYVGDEDALVDAMIECGYTLLALSPRGERVIGQDAPPTDPRIALLLGAEGPGLSARTLSRCRTARIPMAAGWDSLNVAVTSGIALAWLRGGRDINA